MQIRTIHREAMRFLGSGALFFALGIGLATFFRELCALREELAVAFSFVIMLVLSFFLNRFFVFRSSEASGRQFLKFAITSALVRATEYLLFLLFLQILHLNYIASFTLALIVSNSVKFLLYRSLVFGSRSADASSDGSKDAEQ